MPDIKDVLINFSWTGETDDVGQLRTAIAGCLPALNEQRHHRTLLIGGGEGAPAAARSLIVNGVDQFSMLVNTTDCPCRTEPPFEPVGGGRLKVETGGVDWADALRQLVRPLPRDRWDEFRQMLFVEDQPSMMRGYLLLQALAEELGDPQAAVDLAGQLLWNTWRVILTTADHTDLMFRCGGQVLNLYEYGLGRPDKSRIAEEVFLDPPVGLSTTARKALETARNIIIGPGDVHFSVLYPHWLVEGFGEAVRANKAARLILVVNLTARNLDIPGFALSQFLDLYASFLPGERWREIYALVNSKPLSGTADPVMVDDLRHSRYRQFRIVRRPIASDRLTSNRQPAHDEDLLGLALLELLK